MHAYTVEPLYVQHGQDLIAADFYRPKHQKNLPWSLWRMALQDCVILN